MHNNFNVRHYKVHLEQEKKTKYDIKNIKFNNIKLNSVLTLLVVSLCIFLFDRTMCYKEKLENYNIDNINEHKYEKLDFDTNFYFDNSNEENIKKEIAASSLVSCINNKIDLATIPINLKDKIDKLNDLYNSDNNYFAFLYKDIYTGLTVSYNADAPIFTASTIKAPAMIYLYEKASNGEIDLNEELVYDGTFFSDGSGVLKDKELNTSYSIDTLIGYAIHDSDNIAYAMLMNRFGRENILNFWKEKGTKNIYTHDTIWGTTSANDASIYMKELYNFYLENDEYGNELMNRFKNAEWKQIKDKNGKFNTANKGGWCDETFHDIAIVFDENPYILVVLSTAGNDYSGYTHLFNETSSLVGEFHTDYWKYKIDECSKIKQY